MLIFRGAESSYALVGAVDWLRAAFLGQTATAVAVIAVAAIGLMMLSGRVPVRGGATVILGCFILFGARTIADGLLAGFGRSGATVDILPPAPQPVYQPTAPKPQVYDPYAGAAVPTQPPAQGVFPR